MDSVLYQDSGGIPFQQEPEHGLLNKMDGVYSRLLSSDTEEITDANIAWSTAIAVVILTITISLTFFCLCFDGVWTIAERLEEMFITPVVTKLREEHFELEMRSEKKTLKDIFAPILRAIFSRTDEKSDDDDDEEEDDDQKRKNKKARHQARQIKKMKEIEAKLRAAKKRPKEVKTRTVLPPVDVAAAGAAAAADRTLLGGSQTPTLLRAAEAEVAARPSEAAPSGDTRALQMWMTSNYAGQKKKKKDDLDLSFSPQALGHIEALEAGGGLDPLSWDVLLGGEDIEYPEDKEGRKGGEGSSEAGEEWEEEPPTDDEDEGGNGAGEDDDEDGDGEEGTGWYRVAHADGAAVALTFQPLDLAPPPPAAGGLPPSPRTFLRGKMGKSSRRKNFIRSRRGSFSFETAAQSLYDEQKRYFKSLTEAGIKEAAEEAKKAKAAQKKAEKEARKKAKASAAEGEDARDGGGKGPVEETPAEGKDAGDGQGEERGEEKADDSGPIMVTLPKGTVVRRGRQRLANGAWRYVLEDRIGEEAAIEVATFEESDEAKFEEIPEYQTWYRVKTTNARVFKNPTTGEDPAAGAGVLGTLKKDALVASWNWKVYDRDWRWAGERISDCWCVQTGCTRLREYAYPRADGPLNPDGPRRLEPARFCELHKRGDKMEKTGFSECTHSAPDSNQKCKKKWEFLIDGATGSRACSDHKQEMLDAKEARAKEGEEEKKGDAEEAKLEEEGKKNKILLAEENMCQHEGCQLPWRYSTGGDDGEEAAAAAKSRRSGGGEGEQEKGGRTYGAHYCEGHGKEVATQRCTVKDCDNLRQYGYANGPPRFCSQHFETKQVKAINLYKKMGKDIKDSDVDGMKMERLDTHNFCEFPDCKNPWLLYGRNYKGEYNFACEDIEHRTKLIEDVKKRVPNSEERHGRCLNDIFHDGELCSNARTYGHEGDGKPIVCFFHKKPNYVKLDEPNQCAKRGCTESWSHFKPDCLEACAGKEKNDLKKGTHVPELIESGDQDDNSALSLSFGDHYCAKHCPADEKYVGHVTRCAHTAQQDPRWFKMLRKGFPANRQLIVYSPSDVKHAKKKKPHMKKSGKNQDNENEERNQENKEENEKEERSNRGYVDEMDFYTKPATRMLQELEISFFVTKKTRAYTFPMQTKHGEEVGEGAVRNMGEEVALVQVVPAFMNHPEVRNCTYVQSSFGFFKTQDLVRHYRVNLPLFRHFGAFRRSPGGESVEWDDISVIFSNKSVDVVPPEARFMDHPDVITERRCCLGLRDHYHALETA